MWLESLGLGLATVFLALGLLGAFIPLVPGALLAWLTVLLYSVATGFRVVEGGPFAAITIIALVSGTAEYWLAAIGAKVGGASGGSLLWGMGGAITGLLVLNLPGALLGYALGILYSEYRKRGNWRRALKASIGGVAGWGVSALVEAAGVIIIIGIFMWQTLGG